MDKTVMDKTVMDKTTSSNQVKLGAPAAGPAAPTLADRVEEAIARQDWPTARSLFAKYLSSPWRASRRVILLAAPLMDWISVLDAEKGLIAEGNLSGPEALPLPMARLGIQARRQLQLLDEGLDLVRLHRRAAPAQAEWIRREAEILSQMGDHDGALAVGREARQAGHPFGPVLIATSLLELGELEECDEVLTEVEAAGKVTPELARLRARYWTASDEHDKALAIHRQLADGKTDADSYVSIAEHAAAARRRDLLDDLLAEVGVWERDPAKDNLFRQAGPSILEAHYQCVVDWGVLRNTAIMLADLPLSPKAARPLGKLILQAGDYALANRLWTRMIEAFPSAPVIWRQHLHVLSLMGDRDKLNAERDEMRRRLPKDTYLSTMSVAEPRSWLEEEIEEFLEFNLNSRNPAQQNKFFASLGEVRLTAEQIGRLRELASSGASPIVATRIELKLLPTKDLMQLEKAVLEPVSFRDLAETATEAKAYISRVTADIAAGKWQGATGDYGMPDSLNHIENIRKEREHTLLFARESYAEAAELLHLLIDRVRRKQPTSLIRLGDGEGHFLPGPNASSSTRQADRAVMLNIWWGSAQVDPDLFNATERRYVEAVDNCDMLAIIPPWRLIAEMSQRKYTTVHRGIFGGIYYCDVMRNKNALVTSMHFPNDLHNWNLWVELFSAVPEISYISCHHMAPWLWSHFGVSTRQEILIPGERQFVGLFDETAAAGGDTLFERHELVCQAIDPRPGEVYLVAAGWLGKIYCDLVRLRGGVAIDIGSLADYWMGFNTRRYRLEQHTNINLGNTLFVDHILEPPTDLERMAGAATICRSSEDGRYNIASPDQDGALEQTTRSRRLLAIGHPRCGANHVAGVFAANGWHVGHETMLRDGMASWSHVADDLQVPYGDNASTTTFEKTVLYVRDPADAIPSTMLENARGPSFAFRRMHIYRGCGIDLMAFPTALERSVASFVYWYDLALRRKIDTVIKVEEAEEAVANFVSEAAVDVGSSDGHETGVGERSLGGEASWSNPFSGKPKITANDYDQIAAPLRLKLEAFCDRFGYALPWAAG